MSFHVQFVAKTPAAALAKVERDAQLPESVKGFLRQALLGVESSQMVSVLAQGHLFKDDYTISTCKIEVMPLALVE